MTKIMLVEDDKSLREIYGVRLLAEGYDIVSAGDGEEALAMAIKERPQLIVSDVMMPKVSGYDMLDILRSTTETKNIRVIMMTALSSEEQRMRAESLGADRYLVKSQVGIEDVVRVVHEVLADTPETMAAKAATAAPTPAAAPVAPAVPAIPATPAPTSPPAMPAPLSQPVTPPPMPAPTNLPPPHAAPPSMPSPMSIPTTPRPLGSTPKPASLKSRVIQPLHDPSIAPVNINDLLDKELAREAGLASTEIPVVETLDQEKAAIDEQLKSFIPPEPTPVIAPAGPPIASAATSVPSLLPTPGIGESGAPVTPVQPQSIPTVAPVTIPIPTPPVPPAPSVPMSQPVAPIAQPAIPPAFTPQPTPPVAAPQQTAPIPAPIPAPTQLPEVPRV